LREHVDEIDIRGRFHQHFYEQLFMFADPKSAKRQVSSAFFALLGSTRVKAACEMLVKLTPEVNFINILQAAFTSKDPKSSKR
jgi:hypothetical protein